MRGHRRLRDADPRHGRVGARGGAFTDAMGRRIPLGAAIVLLTAPGVPSSGATADRAALAARLGLGLVSACDVIAGATGARTASDGRATWIATEFLDPLASRLARAGYPVTFTPELVTWLDHHLPADGKAPDAFLDGEVTTRIAPASHAIPAR